MKPIHILIVTFCLTACERVPEEIHILRARVSGDTIELAGEAQRYTNTFEDKAFSIDYYILNRGTPQLHVYTLQDSSMIRTLFDVPDVVAKFVYTDSKGKAHYYRASEGQLRIVDEYGGILKGAFEFTLVNIRDSTDILQMEDGYFESTLREFDRSWDGVPPVN